MKILAVCRKGNIRSVGIKVGLNNWGYHDVLSVGGLLVSQETLDMLCEWADVILLAKPDHGERIKPKYMDKVNTIFYIGDDLETTVEKQLRLLKL